MDYNELLKTYGRLLVDDHADLFPDLGGITEMVISELSHDNKPTILMDMAITLLHLTRYPDATKYGKNATELLYAFPNTNNILTKMSHSELRQLVIQNGSSAEIYDAIANNTILVDSSDDWIKLAHIITNGEFTENYPHMRLIGKIPHEHQKKYITGVEVPVSEITIWVGLAIKHNLIEHISNRFVAMYLNNERLTISQTLVLMWYLPSMASEIISLSTDDMNSDHTESGVHDIDRVYDILTDELRPEICKYLSGINNGRYVATTISRTISLMKRENIIQLCTTDILKMSPDICVFIIENPDEFDTIVVIMARRSLVKIVSGNWSRTNMEIIIDPLGNIRPLVLDTLFVLYYVEFMKMDESSDPRRIRIVRNYTSQLLKYFMEYKPDMAADIMDKIGNNKTFREIYKEMF